MKQNYENAEIEFKQALSDVRSLGQIHRAKDSEALQEIVETASTDELQHLKETLKQQNKVTRFFTNLSAPIYGLLEGALAVAAIAISQPIAKNQGLTSLDFKSYMKHPASLALIGATIVSGIATKYSMRNSVNTAEAAGLIHGELGTRAVKAAAAQAHITSALSARAYNAAQAQPATQIHQASYEATIQAPAEISQNI